jgi:hypothetical protein
MKPSELFSVVIRTIGLLLLMFAVSQFLMVLLNLVGGGPGNVFVIRLLCGIPSFLVGFWFLRGAPLIVSLAYESGRYDQSEQTELEGDTLEAVMLLKAGRTEEAKAMVDKILNT